MGLYLLSVHLLVQAFDFFFSPMKLKDNADTQTHRMGNIKPLNSPCAHKGVANKTDRTVRQAGEQEHVSHDISG